MYCKKLSGGQLSPPPYPGPWERSPKVPEKSKISRAGDTFSGPSSSEEIRPGIGGVGQDAFSGRPLMKQQIHKRGLSSYPMNQTPPIALLAICTPIPSCSTISCVTAAVSRRNRLDHRTYLHRSEIPSTSFK